MLTEKDYCDYDTCVALYELGLSFEDASLTFERNLLTNRYEEIPRPSLYEAQKWLREEKGIYVMIEAPWKTDDGLGWSHICCNKPLTEEDQEVCFATGGFFDSYEEALLEGIKATVKILKEESNGN